MHTLQWCSPPLSWTCILCSGARLLCPGLAYFAVVLASSVLDFSSQHNTCTTLSRLQHALANKSAPEVCSKSWLPLGALPMAHCALCVTRHPDSLWALSVEDDYIHWHPHAIYTRRHLSTPTDSIAPQVVRILCRPYLKCFANVTTAKRSFLVTECTSVLPC